MWLEILLPGSSSTLLYQEGLLGLRQGLCLCGWGGSVLGPPDRNNALPGENIYDTELPNIKNLRKTEDDAIFKV